MVADACCRHRLAHKTVIAPPSKCKPTGRRVRVRYVLTATASAAQASNGSDGQNMQHAQSVAGDAQHSVSQEPSPSITQRIKKLFGGDKMDMQRLKALGLGAVASYGCVSNVTYGTGLSISWIAFVQQTGELLLNVRSIVVVNWGSPAEHCRSQKLVSVAVGKSPLMPNQWKPFLALYGGFWAAQHLIRPLRFSLALAMAPVFDRFINWVQQQTKWKRQNAFAGYLFLLGSVTSITVFGSIRLFAGPIAFATI